MAFDDLVALAERWRADDPDPETALELGGLIEKGAERELADRFAGRLEFGTAGLRGVLGAGPNRMNRAVVRQTTAGLAEYLLDVNPSVKERGVVVGRDGRRLSKEFAADTAGVLAARGIPALVFHDPVPTPLAAFATLARGAAAAVVITASHNPPEYNGYKVYCANGAQIVPPHDEAIAAAIEKVGPARSIPLSSADEARAKNLWRDLEADVGEAYLDALFGLRLHPNHTSGLRAAYTALHGVGGAWMMRALAASGVEAVAVPEQQEPDGRFPTVGFPNPEEPGALDLALALGERVHADFILANDPDADRLSAAVRAENGAMRVLTGNEVGVLLGYYLLTETRPLPEKPLVLTTIVSSAQLGAIARALGARYEETLTGFKWIANRAIEIEEKEGATFLFGYEEALGYTVGRVVRDKDGIGAGVVFADLVGFCRARGMSVLDYLVEIQRRHGLFLAAQRSFAFRGAEGASVMARIVDAFRAAPPERIGEHAVVCEKDYRVGRAREAGVERRLNLPSSNVLQYELEGGGRVTLRPSGTEPKLKYYFELREDLGPSEPVELATARGEKRLANLVEDFLALARDRGQPS